MAASRSGPVAIAVSGGSDSTALMHLAHLWAEQARRDLVILTVDHGLRPDAAGEARFVAETAETLGHRARVLTWRPDKASQQAARRARHLLIATAAREAGAGLVLFGHTLNDLAETLLMRLARPTTLTGAAGPQAVSVSPLWPQGRGLVIGRPLLGTQREELRRWLKTRQVTWVEDPSNEAEAYERVRLRKLIAHIDAGRLQRVAADALRLRAVEDSSLAAALKQHVHVQPSGLIEIRGWPGSPRLQYRLLHLVLQAAAGSDRPGDAKALEAACQTIAGGGPESRLTLAGAWLQRQGGRLLIGRDPGEMRAGWQEEVWDGRYERADGTACPDEALPYLVRHAVPEGEGWREIISERLADWAEALRLGAVFGAEFSLGLQGCETTTHPG